MVMLFFKPISASATPILFYTFFVVSDVEPPPTGVETLFCSLVLVVISLTVLSSFVHVSTLVE